MRLAKFLLSFTSYGLGLGLESGFALGLTLALELGLDTWKSRFSTLHCIQYFIQFI